MITIDSRRIGKLVSQVINVKDELEQQRADSRQQEQNIRTEVAHTRWHRPSYPALASVASFVVAATFMLWLAICLVVIAMFLALSYLCKIIGRLLATRN